MLKSKTAILFVSISYSLLLLYFTFNDSAAILEDHIIVHQDKILHFCAYIFLAFIWGYYMLLSSAKKGILYSFISTLVFGVLLEIIQERVNPSRTFDVLDLMANCIGVIVGTIIVASSKTYLKLK